MPELPEVETMRRGIAVVAGGMIRDVRRPPSRLRPIAIVPKPAVFRRRVIGRRIEAVRRVGKRIVLELDRGDRIVIEPRMTGLVILADPPDRQHLRLILETSDPVRQVLFWDQRGLGVVRLLSAHEFATQYGTTRLGPDALEMSAELLRERLGGSRRAIKVALLDQRAVAGIGNLYASEILHRAGICPKRPCNRLSARQWERMGAAIEEVLQDAIVHQGSTLRDGTYRIARDEPGKFQFCHRVYQRHGQACFRCGAEIVRIVQAQRSTFYCPACQGSR